MKTSIPEQTIYFYIKKYVDSNAKNNFRVGKYIADIVCSYNSCLFDIEYDAYSTHHNKLEKDMKRDKFFLNNGYKIIRMRDKNLSFLPSVINIRFDFLNYTKKSIDLANIGINELMKFFNVYKIIDINNDLETIKKMYKNHE